VRVSDLEVEVSDMNAQLISDITYVISKLPTNNIMGSSDKDNHDTTIDTIASDLILVDTVVDSIKSDLIVTDTIADSIKSDLIVTDTQVDAIKSDLTTVDGIADTIKSDLIITNSVCDTIASDLVIVASDIVVIEGMERTQNNDWGSGGSGGGVDTGGSSGANSFNVTGGNC
jgi:hypothetical protein